MLKPENLAIIGAAVVVWAASQFFGVGEFVDFILLVIGIRQLGFSVLTGARELYYFVTTAVNATRRQDLDVAGQHFAQAVLILGISVVQAVLLRGAANKVVAPSRPQVKLRIQETDPPPADSRPPGTSDLPPDADAAKSAQVARIQGKLALYPEVIDLRTGRAIPFPSEVGDRVPVGQRVPWGSQERGDFITEWYNRGYKTPAGGWENYDIHHILPREYGGGNDFWNLTPVERGTHQDLFNAFWRGFTGL